LKCNDIDYFWNIFCNFLWGAGLEKIGAY